MRSLVIIAAVLALAESGVVPDEMQESFKKFMEKYGRHYATEAEKDRRFQIFSDNMKMIELSNKGKKSFTLGITPHTDRTFEEWRAEHVTGLKIDLQGTDDHETFTAPQSFSEPESVDWVSKGGVTSVKNQGNCGSCWTFSTAGALEGAMFVAGREMVDVSEQHLLACDTVGHGCNGGSMPQAFDWVAANGISSLKDEPYLCQEKSDAQCQAMTCDACQKSTGETCVLGTCNKFNATCNHNAGVINHCECPEDQCFQDGACSAKQSVELVLEPHDVAKKTMVDYDSELSLEAAVAQQPVSVAIEADTAVFQHYTGGILTNDACGSQLDHGVLAVGYGVDQGQKYWKVKNSWGPTWGEDGYIRIAKGKASEGGECGIRKMASFPTVKAKGETIVI